MTPQTIENFGSPLYGQLKQAAGEAWPAYVEHAFVRGLGDGSLPNASFLHYLKQDYVFLIHFTRAWALAVAKSDRVEEMRQMAVTVNALLNDEMPLHVRTCAAIGISETDLAQTLEAPQTLAYTRYVTDAGLRGDLLDLLTALMPCVLGYGDIGASLAPKLVTGEEHPYRDWIETYSGDDYQTVCAGAATLFEDVAARLIGPDPQSSPRWPDLVRTFKTATELERDFWGMGLAAA